MTSSSLLVELTTKKNTKPRTGGLCCEGSQLFPWTHIGAGGDMLSTIPWSHCIYEMWVPGSP